MTVDPESLGPLGYLPDPPKKTGEKRDYDFTTKLLFKLDRVTTGDVDLREHCTSSDQYSAGSCAGNATADSVEVLNSIEGKPKVQLSRLFVYTLARNFMDMDGDGRSDVDRDKGTYIRLCFEVLSKFGICREDLPPDQGGWPYDLSKLHTLPSLKSMRAATGHRIHSYYRIIEEGDNRLNCIIEALRANHPVVFGTQIDSSFRTVQGEEPVGLPTGDIIGGHAMLIVGYLRYKGFIVKNSWGPSWGSNGFCLMRPSYLTWERTRDLWVPTRGANFR